MSTLLEVRNLTKHYRDRRRLRGSPGVLHALNGVSFDLAHGECLGVVGESGSGKSTLGRAILRLETPTSGTVRLDGIDLATLDSAARRRLRRRMQIVFQDPFGSLNPRLSVGASVGEGPTVHRLATGENLNTLVARLLVEVGLQPSDAERFPHEFSGGQRQRIAIARALAVEPELLVCDEPVSALDVSVQAQILALFARLQRERRLAMLFITHDLAVVRQVAARVAVLYAGLVMELGPADQIVERPRHPYTQALVAAVPESSPGLTPRIVLAGEAPNPAEPLLGCPFAPRCFHPRRDHRCQSETPMLRSVGPAEVACHYATEEDSG